MKIALGSQSNNKIEYLKNILDFFEQNNYELNTYAVDSCVSEQPISRDETFNGACNRAKAAFAKDTTVNFAIGMEGGLVVMNKKDYYYECIVVVYNGKEYFTGISSSLAIPKQVSQKIKDYNADLSDELHKYEPKTFNQEVLKEMILSREEIFFEALRNVMLEVLD